MDEQVKKATGLTFTGLLAILVAANWKEIFESLAAGMVALQGFPTLVQAWSAGLPLGMWSFTLALVLGMALWGLFWIHPMTKGCALKPHTCADTAAVATGFVVEMAQQFATDHSPARLLSAMWLGLLAGLLAMYLARLGWSLFTKPKGGA